MVGSGTFGKKGLMGIGYICKPDIKLAITVWDGLITWDYWRKHLEKLFSDPDYASMQLQITDLRNSSIGPTITDEEIKAMTDLLDSQRQKVSMKKVAMVAGDEWNKPKLAEFALHAISINAIVFNDLETACIWLGINIKEVTQDIYQIRLKLQQKSLPE
jgi:hypothetical protein